MPAKRIQPPPSWKEIGAMVVLVLLGLFVAFRPGVVYSPSQRTLLYLIVSVMVATTFGNVVAKVTIKIGWLVCSYGGAAAVAFGLTWWLTDLSKPDRQIAVYHVFSPTGEEYDLSGEDVVTVETSRGGLRATSFVDGNTIVLIFPEQLPEARIGVRYPPASGQRHWAVVHYAGSEETNLAIGGELKPRNAP